MGIIQGNDVNLHYSFKSKDPQNLSNKLIMQGFQVERKEKEKAYSLYVEGKNIHAFLLPRHAELKSNSDIGISEVVFEEKDVKLQEAVEREYKITEGKECLIGIPLSVVGGAVLAAYPLYNIYFSGKVAEYGLPPHFALNCILGGLGFAIGIVASTNIYLNFLHQKFKKDK